MNFALSDEQELLKEAARGALARVKTVEAAREALDGNGLPDLWPTAVEAGWPGLLISEEHDGAGLGALDGMLVFAELGRVLASVPLLGHLPATLLLDAGGADGLEALASGERRAAFVAAKPPSAICGAAPRVEPSRASTVHSASMSLGGLAGTYAARVSPAASASSAAPARSSR